MFCRTFYEVCIENAAGEWELIGTPRLRRETAEKELRELRRRNPAAFMCSVWYYHPSVGMVQPRQPCARVEPRLTVEASTRLPKPRKNWPTIADDGRPRMPL